MTDQFDPDEIDEMFERMDPAHDPELQRQRIADRLAGIAYEMKDYGEGGETFTVEEPAVLTPGIEDRDYEWELTYDGDGSFTVTDPDGTDREMPLSTGAEDQVNDFGQVATAYHRERLVDEFHERRENQTLDVGDAMLFPIVPKVVVRELGVDDHCEVAIYGPGYDQDVVQVIAGEDLEASTLETIVDDWRDAFEADLGGDA